MADITLDTIAKLWPGCDPEHVRQQLIDIDTRPREARQEAIVRRIMSFGHPQGAWPAYPDLHPDVIVSTGYAESEHLSAGDIRALQAFLRDIGIQPRDRLSTLMAEIPSAGGAH